MDKKRLRYDILLRGGHVIDPKNGIDAAMDIAVGDGRVAAVAQRIAPEQAKQVMDVSGLYVTPGLVDMHVHVFYNTAVPGVWAGDNSIQPDGFSFRTGTTTMVDAGSAGWRNFETFRANVINRVQTRVLAFINIAGLGMTSNMAEQGDFNPQQAAQVAGANRDVVVGIKTAHYEKPDWNSVDSALDAGRLADIPVMVDFGFFLPERPYWKLVTERLRPGDISTHMFRGPVPWTGDDGKVYEYLKLARAHGVIFDVGHGGASFVFRNAVPAVQQGFFPDTISTDLHAASMNAGTMDLPTTMSKFLAMGMPYADVISAATWRPSQVIHHPDLGHLSVGVVADIAAFRVEDGDFGFYDSYGGKLTGNRRLRCELTMKDGKIVWDLGGRGGTDYRNLGSSYGIWETDRLIPPPKQGFVP
jgi:dihydroorotase